MYCLISRQMALNPEAAVIVAGDFNHVELKAVLTKYQKFIHPTREIAFIATSQGLSTVLHHSRFK